MDGNYWIKWMHRDRGVEREISQIFDILSFQFPRMNHIQSNVYAISVSFTTTFFNSLRKEYYFVHISPYCVFFVELYCIRSVPFIFWKFVRNGEGKKQQASRWKKIYKFVDCSTVTNYLLQKSEMRDTNYNCVQKKEKECTKQRWRIFGQLIII